MDLLLTKYEKLKCKKYIDKLFFDKKFESSAALKLMYLPLDLDKKNLTLIGFSVPKKCFRKATDRNYIKRLMREVYRKKMHLLKLDKSYAFMLLYYGKSIPDYKYVCQHIQNIVIQFNKKNNGV